MSSPATPTPDRDRLRPGSEGSAGEGSLKVSSPPARVDFRLAPLLWVALLAIGCALVLRAFASPIIWAAILACATWPIYRYVRGLFGRRDTAAALVVTVIVSVTVILPPLWLLVLARDELATAIRLLSDLFTQPRRLSDLIGNIPRIGQRLQQIIDTFSADPSWWGRELTGWMQTWASALASGLATVSRNLAKLLFTGLTLFFFYRDGEILWLQIRRVAVRFGLKGFDRYEHTIATMTRSVLFGFVITALAQGLVAGIGYRVVGVRAPVLLGGLTAVLSVIPLFGTALVWFPLSVWLLVNNQIWQGVVMLAWGILLVHPIDNLLRPILISGTSRVPFLLMLFGVLGGLAAFGLVGIFIGPIILELARLAWQDWAASRATPEGSQ